MPTVFTHAAVAGITGKIYFKQSVPAHFWILSIYCAVIPDADVLGFFYGIDYADFWGHRGFFHSLFFSLVQAVVLGLVFLRKYQILSLEWLKFVLFLFVIGASHGILDCFTNGGLGIALFSPFENSRYFFPYALVEVSPIGINSFLGTRGLSVLISEFSRVLSPLIMILLVVQFWRKKRSVATME